MYFGIAFWLWVCICLLLVYFFTETWWWHRQSALEERMIGLWSALVTVCFLFTNDSPLLWLPFVPRYWITDFAVVMCMYFSARSLAHEMEMNRLNLKNKGSFFRLMNDKLRFTSHRIKPRMPTKETKEIMKEIGVLLDKLRLGVAPDLNRVISSNVLVKAEEKILELFQNLSNAELSLIVTTINVGMLVSNVRDRPNGWGKFTHHKRRLLQFLCIDRLAAMDAAARAAILNGMQVAGLFKHYDDASRMAAYILTHTYGTDLAVVKALLDNTGNYHSLHRLMFYDVQPESIREQVLCHILKEGQALRKEQSHSVVSLKARKRLSGDFGNQINSLRPPLRSVASMANFRTYIDDDDEDHTPVHTPVGTPKRRLSDGGNNPTSQPLMSPDSHPDSSKNRPSDSKDRSTRDSPTSVRPQTPNNSRDDLGERSRTIPNQSEPRDTGKRAPPLSGILSSGSGGSVGTSLDSNRQVLLGSGPLSSGSGSGSARVRVSMNQDVTVSTNNEGSDNGTHTPDSVQLLKDGGDKVLCTSDRTRQLKQRQDDSLYAHLQTAERAIDDFSETKVVSTRSTSGLRKSQIQTPIDSDTGYVAPTFDTQISHERLTSGSVGRSKTSDGTVMSHTGTFSNLGRQKGALTSASTEAALNQIRACFQMRHQNEHLDVDSPTDHRRRHTKVRRRRNKDRHYETEDRVVARGVESEGLGYTGDSNTDEMARNGAKEGPENSKGVWATLFEGLSGSEVRTDTESSTSSECVSDTDMDTDVDVAGGLGVEEDSMGSRGKVQDDEKQANAWRYLRLPTFLHIGGERVKPDVKNSDTPVRVRKRKESGDDASGFIKRTHSGMSHLSGDLLPVVDVLEYKTDDGLVAMATKGDSTEKEYARIGKTKVLSDVDDTLVCSGGDRIAGIDYSIPRKALYPGVLLFYRLLEMGDTASAGPESIVWPPGRVGNMVMLSARPHIYKDATERATYALFEKLVKEKEFYCIPSLLAGSIGGIKGMKAERNGVYMASFEDVYTKKLQNLNELKTLYPEENFVFIGDNGQADVKVADEALKTGVLSYAFVHLVQPIEQTFGYNAEEPYSPNIIFFSTYLEAAMLAFKAKLIGNAGLTEMVRVCTVETEELLAAARDKHPTHWPPRLKSKFVRKINTHILEVCDLQNLKMPLVELGDLDLLLPRSNSSTFKRASLAMVGAAAFVGRKISLGRFETQSDNGDEADGEGDTLSVPPRDIDASPLSPNSIRKRADTINIGSLSPGRQRPNATGSSILRKALNHTVSNSSTGNHGNELMASGRGLSGAGAHTHKSGNKRPGVLPPIESGSLLTDNSMDQRDTAKTEENTSEDTLAQGVHTSHAADIPLLVGPDSIQNTPDQTEWDHPNTSASGGLHDDDDDTSVALATNASSDNTSHTIRDEATTTEGTREPDSIANSDTAIHTSQRGPTDTNPRHTGRESIQLQHSQSAKEEILSTPLQPGLGSFSNDSIASARSCPVTDNVDSVRASALLGDPKFLSVRPHIEGRRSKKV